jgi:hypothetical protein
VRRGPVETAFLVDEQSIRTTLPDIQPRGGRHLPFDFYGKAAYTRRGGRRGFTFVNELEAFERRCPKAGCTG